MPVSIGIAAIAIVVAACIVGLLSKAGISALRSGIVVAAAMAVEIALAASGVLADWNRVPPPMMLVVGGAILIAVATAFSSVGTRVVDRVSFALIIGYQSFRLPLELVMHRAANIGLMPGQMTFTGRNFDIVTGALAIPVAWLVTQQGRPPFGLIRAWNIIGTLLLINIVAIAVASLPMFAAFGPDRLNTWVAHAPYIWLPGVLVPAALFGHIVTWRKIWRTWRATSRRSGATRYMP
jgi:hypothetical protein